MRHQYKNMRTKSSDEFQTPEIAIHCLLPYLKSDWYIWECAWRDGSLARHLTNFGFKVVGGKHLDFLKTKYAIMPEPTVIVTNPPYSLKDEFIRHCYEIGLPFALLLPLSALGGKRRNYLYREFGINLIIPNKRINFVTPSGKCYAYDAVYVSSIFDINKYVEIIGCDSVEFGGTGYFITKQLPEEIDALEEDYSIYPDNNSSYGFITRGCIRNCPFCFVPQKEGKLYLYRNWKDIVKHKTTYFLDNNFLAYKGHEDILRELVKYNIQCQFNQGLDIRLLTNDNAKLLSEMNYIGEYIFAFDDCHYEHAVNIGLSIFRKYEKRDWREKFFVYCDAERHTISDVVYRVDWCIKNKVLPYLMRNKNCWESKNKDFYIDLASYCNQYNLVKKITFEQYIKKRQFNNKDRYENSLRLYNDGK